MSDQLYRFYSTEHQVYMGRMSVGTTTDEAKAGLFTKAEWDQWGRELGYDVCKPVKTDQEMIRVNAPRLPGLDN